MKPAEWQAGFKAAIRTDTLRAIAMARQLVSKPSTSTTVNARILGTAVGLCIDLAMEHEAEELFGAYVATGTGAPKQQQALQRRVHSLPDQCAKARTALRKAECGDTATLDEDDWRYIVRIRAGQAFLEPLLTDPKTGGFLAVSQVVKATSPMMAEMGEMERRTSRATPSGSDLVVKLFDGSSWIAPPVSFVHEGTWPGEESLDTASFVAPDVRTESVLRMKRMHDFRHVERFGRSVRFYATRWGGANDGQSIEHRFWLLCDDDRFAAHLVEMAHTSEWIGARVQNGKVGTRLLVESYYGEGKGSHQLGIMDDIVIDTDGESTFEPVALNGFLKRYYDEHKQPYPIVDECLKGHLSINTTGKAWVRFPAMRRFPSADAARAFYEMRRLTLWRRGLRLVEYIPVPLGRP
jgi:hypothetical protein